MRLNSNNVNEFAKNIKLSNEFVVHEKRPGLFEISDDFYYIEIFEVGLDFGFSILFFDKIKGQSKYLRGIEKLSDLKKGDFVDGSNRNRRRR